MWSEHGRVRIAALSEQGKLGGTKDLMPGKGHTYADILDVGVRHQGYLLGKKENMAVQIIDVREGGRILDEFESSHHSADKSDSDYTASTGVAGTTMTRVYWSFSMKMGVAQTYTVSSDGMISTAFTFPFDTTNHGVLQAAAVSPTGWSLSDAPASPDSFQRSFPASRTR